MTNTIIHYNEDELKQLSNNELSKIISELNIDMAHLSRKLRAFHPKLLDELVFRTHFLDDLYGTNVVPMPARLYCIYHNINECPKCSNPNCNNKVKWRRINFNIYCCKDCGYSDENRAKKAQQTCLRHFGVTHQMKHKSVIDKIKQTNLQRYGFENPAQSAQIRAKIEQTCIERYGHKCSLQNKEIHDKAISTMINKFGVEYPLQNIEIQNKFKQTSVLKYGTEYPMQSEQVKQNLAQSLLYKYGVDNFSKSPLFALHHTNRIFHDNIWFDSSWEVKVYDFLKKNNITFEYSPKIVLPYEYDGGLHYYHPDFLTCNKLYEVKGDNFFRIDESTGQEEMFCPYRDEDWSDEKYDWMCSLYEAKHQCMIQNNVVILRSKEVNNLTIELFQ